MDTGEPLEGAVIRVSRRGSSEYTEVTTGKDGTALLKGLEEDWYQVQEICSPEGYILDDTVHDVELIAGQTATVVLTNSKEPGLTIKKVDAETGDPLPGAVFRVTKRQHQGRHHRRKRHRPPHRPGIRRNHRERNPCARRIPGG